MYGGEGPGFKSTRWLWSFCVEFGFSIRPTMQLLSSSPLFTRGCHSGSSACLIGQIFTPDTQIPPGIGTSPC